MSGEPLKPYEVRINERMANFEVALHKFVIETRQAIHSDELHKTANHNLEAEIFKLKATIAEKDAEIEKLNNLLKESTAYRDKAIAEKWEYMLAWNEIPLWVKNLLGVSIDKHEDGTVE